jgi:amino acid transporter
MRASAQASLLVADGKNGAEVSQHVRRPIRVPPNFPGWGEVVVVEEPSTGKPATAKEQPHPPKLGQLTSTAICGNDITGSCFYVIGGLAAAAGVWAPIGAVFACITLWLFRWVYTETVTALPFNGGIYNVLLNTVKSKRAAALLATLTIFSYVATAVVSALSAATYMQGLINPQNNRVLTHGNYTVEIAIGIIGFFAVLKLIGISESANVAACMFVGHIFTMGFLICFVALSVCLPASLSPLGWTAPIPFDQVAQNLKTNFRFSGGNAELAAKITMGFSKAMLGVSGFETSANFVEEQSDGVFPKTLRNMWVLVSVFNICLIVECLFAVKLEGLIQDQDRALAYLAR